MALRRTDPAEENWNRGPNFIRRGLVADNKDIPKKMPPALKRFGAPGICFACWPVVTLNNVSKVQIRVARYLPRPHDAVGVMLALIDLF